MVDHNVGVSHVGVNELKRVDSDYFETKPDGTASQSPTEKYIDMLHNRTLT